MELARNLIRLTYYSQTTEVLNDKILEEILEASWRNNSRDRITGVLYHNNFGFVQILEGDRIPVSLCYTRISQDLRHKNPVIMGCTPIQNRAFPDWPMRLITETPEIRSLFPDTSGHDEVEPWTYSEPVLVEAIKSLVGPAHA